MGVTVDLVGTDLMVHSAVHVRPGDTLVVAIDQHYSSQEMVAFKERFEQRLPGVKVTVVTARQLLVYRPELSDQ